MPGARIAPGGHNSAGRSLPESVQLSTEMVTAPVGAGVVAQLLNRLPHKDTTVTQRMAYERGAKEVPPSRIRKRFGRLRSGPPPAHAACSIHPQGSNGPQRQRGGFQLPGRNAARRGDPRRQYRLHTSHAAPGNPRRLIVGPGLAWLCAGAFTPRSPSSFPAGPAKDLA